MPDVDAAKPRTESLVRNYTTRHARIDAEGQEVVVVGACCKFFVKAPWAIALITGLSTVVLSGVGLMPMEGLVPKNTGWTNRESVVQQSWASFEVLRDSRYDGEQPPPPPPAAQRRQLRWGSTPLDGRRLWEPQLANAEERRGPLLYQDPTPSLSLFREWQLSEYKFVYDTFGAGILQPDVVSSMIALERAVLDFPAWQSYCKLEYSNGYDCDSAADAGACGVAALPRKSACATPQSLLSYLHTNDAKHEAECRQGFCVSRTLQSRASHTRKCSRGTHERGPFLTPPPPPPPTLTCPRLAPPLLPHAIPTRSSVLPTFAAYFRPACGGSDDVRHFYRSLRRNVRSYHDCLPNVANLPVGHI